METTSSKSSGHRVHLLPLMLTMLAATLALMIKLQMKTRMVCRWSGRKGSDKILKHINARLDKLELPKLMLEKVQGVEEQEKLEQDNRGSCLEKAVSSLKNGNNALRLKVDDLEGQSCRNNFKTVGIPKKKEGRTPEEFIKAFMLQLLGKENFQTLVIIDRTPQPRDSHLRM